MNKLYLNSETPQLWGFYYLDSIYKYVCNKLNPLKIYTKRCIICKQWHYSLHKFNKNYKCVSCTAKEVWEKRIDKKRTDILSRITQGEMENFYKYFVPFLTDERKIEIFDKYKINMLGILKEKGLLSDIDSEKIKHGKGIIRVYLKKAFLQIYSNKEINFTELGIKNKLKLGLENDIIEE